MPRNSWTRPIINRVQSCQSRNLKQTAHLDSVDLSRVLIHINHLQLVISVLEYILHSILSSSLPSYIESLDHVHPLSLVSKRVSVVVLVTAILTCKLGHFIFLRCHLLSYARFSLSLSRSALFWSGKTRFAKGLETWIKWQVDLSQCARFAVQQCIWRKISWNYTIKCKT
jgi:hypothetical protein